jgi:hypothetical protein
LEFLLPRAQLRRVPRSTHPGRQAGAGRVRVAKPPPVPSSGFLPLSTVLAAHAARTNPLRSPPFAVTPRRFAALFHAARAPGVALQSFPFSRSRTRSRGPRASLRVRVRPPNGAADPRVSRPLSPIAPTSRRSWPEGFAGLEGRDDGSLESLGAARHALPRSFTTSRLVSAGLAGLGGRHARFEALLPSRVRSRDDRSLARARSSFQVGALLGFSFPLRAPCGSRRVQSPLESAPAIPWVRSARRRTWSGRTRASCAARTSYLATRIRQVLAPAVGSRTHGPPTCPADRAVHATVKQRPCSQALSRSTCTPVASPVRSCVGGRSPFRPPRRRDVLPAPPLGGAPCLPRPSSAHHREGVHGWTSETLWIFRSAGGPASREVGHLF